jgi:hypothetical protein
MKLKKYLINEETKKNVIVVDVQPLYRKYISFNLGLFTEFLNENKKILCFFNGPDTVGSDSKEEILEFYLDNGLEPERFPDFTWVDKGYGFFRAWMDMGADERDIKRALRFMLEKRVYDSRDIPEEEWEEKFPDMWRNEFRNDPIFLPPTIRVDKLRKWKGSYLVGGGRNECLKEIEILMSTFNINYKLVKKFVY